VVVVTSWRLYEAETRLARGPRDADCRLKHAAQNLVALAPSPGGRPWQKSCRHEQRRWKVKRTCERVAGLDVHKDSVVACAQVLEGKEVSVHKARFGATTDQVAALADWLADLAVTRVAMEASGVYWKPVYYGLEGLFPELWLCNPQHVKNVPGRKTDMADAEWLADVAAHGMVRPSVVPEPGVRELRELTRYRKSLVDERVREIQRLDKALQDAGIKLSSVACRIMSKSGRAMVEALISGERDPQALAGLALGRMRAKIPALEAAMAGRFSTHHAVVARQVLAHIDFLDASVATLDQAIRERMGPFEPAVGLLTAMPGWGRETAEVFLAETGADMSKFPSAAHLASWCRICPANHESAGKRQPVAKKPGKTWLGRALIEAAKAAARSDATYFAAQYYQVSRRRGANKAAVAVAHSMVVAAWHILTTGEHYHDLGPNHFRHRTDPSRLAQLKLADLQLLGWEATTNPDGSVTLTPPATAA
jgi:transposase